MDSLHAYARKQAIVSELADVPVHGSLGLIVVIPCHDEPNLLDTLTSLRQCRRPRAAVEVLLICNASECDPALLRRRNQTMIQQVHAWRGIHEDPRFRIHVMNFPRLPSRHAGVGMARKIGMDQALLRLSSAGNPRGVIASLDADCSCDDNYLTALETHFQCHPNTRACTVYFEHDLNGPLDDALYQAITRYELFLRYYRHGMKFARFPYAHYTVGSCLAVRCDHYARHGGMNRRKAGEDFYFLNKLIAVGGVTENTATRVVPAVRASTRTPFGTGRALGAWLGNGCQSWKTYDARVFRDLGALVGAVDRYYDQAPGRWQPAAPLSASLLTFLRTQGVVDKHAEIRANCATRESFRKRFFQWFDGFLALKFIHHASAEAYPRQALEQACHTLLAWQGASGVVANADAKELLLHFRRLDRKSLSPQSKPLPSTPLECGVANNRGPL